VNELALPQGEEVKKFSKVVATVGMWAKRAFPQMLFHGVNKALWEAQAFVRRAIVHHIHS